VKCKEGSSEHLKVEMSKRREYQAKARRPRGAGSNWFDTAVEMCGKV